MGGGQKEDKGRGGEDRLRIGGRWEEGGGRMGGEQGLCVFRGEGCV